MEFTKWSCMWPLLVASILGVVCQIWLICNTAKCNLANFMNKHSKNQTRFFSSLQIIFLDLTLCAKRLKNLSGVSLCQNPDLWAASFIIHQFCLLPQVWMDDRDIIRVYISTVNKLMINSSDGLMTPQVLLLYFDILLYCFPQLFTNQNNWFFKSRKDFQDRF